MAGSSDIDIVSGRPNAVRPVFGACVRRARVRRTPTKAFRLRSSDVVRPVFGSCSANGGPLIGRGDDTFWKPSSNSTCSIRAFRAYPLIEIRQAVPCRAIRGSRISVNGSPPPSSLRHEPPAPYCGPEHVGH